MTNSAQVESGDLGYKKATRRQIVPAFVHPHPSSHSPIYTHTQTHVHILILILILDLTLTPTLILCLILQDVQLSSIGPAAGRTARESSLEVAAIVVHRLSSYVCFEGPPREPGLFVL